MRYVKSLFVVLLLSTLAQAASISYINLQIEETGKVNVRETVSVSGEGLTEDTVWVPKNIEGLSVYDLLGPLSFNVSEEKERKIVTFRFPPLTKKTKNDVSIEYSSQHLTSKSKGVWELEFEMHSTAARTIIKIGFPKNSTILNWTSYRFSVGPDILYIYPDTDEVNFTATYQFAGENKPSSPYPAYLLTLIIIIFLAYILLRRKKKVKTEVAPESAEPKKDAEPKEEKPKREIKDSVYKMLEENELKVVDVLLSALDEEITQAQIYHTTRIPKASLSDIMNRLERRNIVERTKQGRVKWVKLKEWVYK